MPSIRVEVSEKEMRAIEEFAKQCGETVPDLLKKVAIRDATLADGFGADDSSYEYRMITSHATTGSQEHQLVEDNYNRVRRILGWHEISL
jgi:hypothetical protein